METLEKICLILMIVNIIFCIIAFVKKIRVDEERAQDLAKQFAGISLNEIRRLWYKEVVLERKNLLMILPLALFLLFVISVDAGFSWLILLSMIISWLVSAIAIKLLDKKF